MLETTSKFIEDNIQLIEDRKWEKVLTSLSQLENISRNQVVEIFLKSNIDFLENVVDIPSHAFTLCSCIKKIELPRTVQRIGSAAFNSCFNLTSIKIPDSVTDIDRYAFLDCSRLTTITIPDKIVSIEMSVFNGCSNLVNITIPNSVQIVEEHAFHNCRNLTDVYFHGTVDEWKQIDIEEAGNYLLQRAVIHCDDGIVD